MLDQVSMPAERRSPAANRAQLVVVTASTAASSGAERLRAGRLDRVLVHEARVQVGDLGLSLPRLAALDVS